jgi:hypothetical protein
MTAAAATMASAAVPPPSSIATPAELANWSAVATIPRAATREWNGTMVDTPAG